MICPECKNNTEVIDSRNEQRFVRRRRQCQKCKYRFTTYEKIDSPKIQIQKRDSSIEFYRRDKLSKGIHLAFEKRPFSSKQIESFIDDIEHEMSKSKNKTISSKAIGDIVTQKLKEADEVAYLRFLSVYKSFGSAKKFLKEAEKLGK